MICKVEGCERTDKISRGFCARHYENFRTTGNPLSLREQRADLPPVKCAVDDCDRNSVARGWCNRHYENWRNTGDPIPARDKPLVVVIESIGWDVTDGGCWEWRGARNGHGYGLVSLHREGVKAARAHRVVYESRRGPIPRGAVLRHSCDNPPCVNPDHLKPGTHKQNMEDMAARGRSGVSYEARGGRCPNGHDVTSPDSFKVRMKPDGSSYRMCIECDRARKRRYAEKARQVTGAS